MWGSAGWEPKAKLLRTPRGHDLALLRAHPAHQRVRLQAGVIGGQVVVLRPIPRSLDAGSGEDLLRSRGVGIRRFAAPHLK